MAWVRIDDHIDEHPKIQAAGPLGLALFVSGLAYCNRNRTDGFIPASKAAVLLGPSGAGQVIAALVAAGLWRRVDGGFWVHDYLDYQLSREQIEKERSRTAQRQAAFRLSHSNAHSNAVTNGVSNAQSNGLVTLAPIPKTSTSKDKDSCPAAPDGFPDFYALYPRREKRRAAEKAWRGMSAKDRAAAMEGLRRFVRDVWPGKDREFIPHPASWLNGRRWEDELAAGVFAGEKRSGPDAALEKARRAREEWEREQIAGEAAQATIGSVATRGDGSGGDRGP